MVHTHQIAPTPFVEANDVRFAYRRFGKPVGVPLVFNQHFTGTMDHWDPAVTDGLATEREVLRSTTPASRAARARFRPLSSKWRLTQSLLSRL
jgi:hypothetical protein